MKCPICEHEFKLSWPMYLKSPFGRHSCPKCQSRFQLRHTVRYYLELLALIGVFAVIPSVVAIYLNANGIVVTFIYLVGALAVLLFDKQIDDTWRGTVAKR